MGQYDYKFNTKCIQPTEAIIELGGGWRIRVRYYIPEIWQGDELLGWWEPKAKNFVFHHEKEIPKKILTSFKLYCLNIALH